MEEQRFDIPVVLIIFKRKKAVEIIQRISLIKPKKLYILGDNGRNKKEKAEVAEVRKLVENSINWDCEVIKNYSEENRGVYANIGLGAKWVFEREEKAIFLEDDNLPEPTFFEYCREMLDMYENDTRILWVTGTNYLGKYQPNDGASYMFTNHLLPCGWASWSKKFNRFYDTELKLSQNKIMLSRIEKQYYNKKLYKQYKKSWTSEYQRIENGERPISWDYHMDFTLKSNGLYGISPRHNQIKNIGVDEHSIHGGNSLNDIMTRRFTGMESYPLEFPLKHPSTVLPDLVYEEKIGKILMYPFNLRIRFFILGKIRRILKIPDGTATKYYFKSKFNKKNN